MKYWRWWREGLRSERSYAAAAFLATMLVWAGCGGSSSPGGSGGGTGGGGTGAAPVLSSLSPIVVMAGTSSLTLVADGSNFTATSVISFNGSAKATSMVNAGELSTTLSATDLSQAGTFSVTVSDNGQSSSTLSFYIVPGLKPSAVQVVAGSETSGVNVSVGSQTPKLTFIGAGVGTETAAAGATVAPGESATIFVVGQGVVPGTFYVVGGDNNDVTVTQPLVKDFTQATGNLPAVSIKVTVSSAAHLGAKNILITNPTGEVAVFVGGLMVGSGT